MYRELIELAGRLAQYDKIVFYGAGNVAGQIYDRLREIDIAVDFCIVTEKKDKCLMQEFVPVYQLDECVCDLKNDGTIILIAVSGLYENEIEGILKKHGIANYLRYSDFLAENKTIEYDIEAIVGWGIVKFKKAWKEFEALKRNLEEEIKTPKGSTILFLIGDLSPRALKIMKAMRDRVAGVKAIFYPNALLRPCCKEEFDGLGIAYTECECIQELVYSIILEHAKVAHMFSSRSNSIVPYTLVKMKAVLPPLVYDEYDIINEFYHNQPKDWLEQEKFCLENSDGICGRGYELDYMTQSCEYHFNGKILQFFDYCRDEDVKGCISRPDGALSICYAGGVTTCEEYPDCPFAISMAFIEMCEKNRCCLHVYPTSWDEEWYRKYIEKDRESEYFYFHRPVPYGILKEELSQYDYGIMPARDDIWDKEISGYNTKYKYIYTAANKLFDYLDAGLPIIAAWPLKMTEYLEGMGVMIKWTNGQYDFEFLRRNRHKYREAAVKAQKGLQIKNHIHKLAEFYEGL